MLVVSSVTRWFFRIFWLSLLAAAPAWAEFLKKDVYLSYEQRLVASMLLQAEGQSAQNRAQTLLRVEELIKSSVQTKVQEVWVENFQDFMKEFRGVWPETDSLARDLEINAQKSFALREFKSKHPRVQREIDQYLEFQLNQLKKLAETQKESSSVKNQVESMNLNKLYQSSMEKLNLGQEQAAKQYLFESLLNVSDLVVKDALSEFGKIGERVATSGFSQQSDASARIFMQTLLSEYFGRLSIESKKQIISAMMAAPLELSEMQRFEIMVQNSGPQLQKLLQIVARQANLDPELLKVFKTLENAVRPVPWVQVRDMVQAESSNYRFLYFERKPLGVGTMAQVHRAKIEENGQRRDVVVRFIKPGIENRINEDHRILMEVAAILDSNFEFAKSGAPKLTPIIEDVTQTVRAELSQKDTVDRQLKGREVYNRQLLMETPEYKNLVDINVPLVYAPKNKQTQFMVQEMVFGRKLDKEADAWKEAVPGMKKALVEMVAKVWMEELMFKSGFYHSDLHQGNFMVQMRDDAIKLNILDFGMGGVISKSMQKNLVLLGAGLELNKADLISKAMWALSDQNKNLISETEYRQIVAKQAETLAKTGQKWGVGNWSALSLDSGLRLPYDFISINRGQVIIDKLLEDSGSSMTVQNIAKKLAFKYPAVMAKILLQDAKLSPGEIIKLGFEQLIKKQEKVPSFTDSMANSKQNKSVGGAALRCEFVFN